MTLSVDNPQSPLSVGWWLEVGATHPLRISYQKGRAGEGEQNPWL
jgi:hypothetical protein